MRVSLPPDRLQRLAPVARSPADRVDLPRQRRELLRDRARLLDDDDRQLLLASLDRGLTTRQLARLLGLHPSSVARRLQALRRRLCDRRVVALIDAAQALEPVDRQIGLGTFLRGQTIARLATETGLSEPRVRQRLLYVHGWLQGQHDGAVAAARALASRDD